MEAQSVSWINVVPLNRREKIARWWVDDVRQQQTYSSARQRQQEFQTFLAVEAIDALACDALKEALYRQRDELETHAPFVTLPRATPDGSRYFGSIGIPARPLGVRFTSCGSEPTFDEDN